MKEEMEQALVLVKGQIGILQDAIAALPPGKLVCARNGSWIKWYWDESHSQTYIPKWNRALAEQLAEKACKEQKLVDLENKRAAICAYLDVRKTLKLEDRIELNPKYAELLIESGSPISKELEAWASAPYEKNPVYPERKVHQCCSGEIVRSKSESMIAQALYLRKIPFRYECALHDGCNIIYPDFMIRHPQTGELYYWEHFGMMDDAFYVTNVRSKLKFYIEQGILPSINLIITYESRDKPLTSAKIEAIVQEYFGNGLNTSNFWVNNPVFPAV